MTARNKYLKALAFVPAVVLAGGFIGYRAGAFPFLTKSEPPPAVQPEPTAPPAAESQASVPAPASGTTVMPSSKYLVITPAPQVAQPAQPAPQPAPPPTPPNPAIIYGSKSAPIFPAPAPPPVPPGSAPNAPKP